MLKMQTQQIGSMLIQSVKRGPSSDVRRLCTLQKVGGVELMLYPEFTLMLFIHVVSPMLGCLPGKPLVASRRDAGTSCTVGLYSLLLVLPRLHGNNAERAFRSSPAVHYIRSMRDLQALLPLHHQHAFGALHSPLGHTR